MSEYSQAMERILCSTGLPFCRGETRMDEPDERVGAGCGVGCTGLEPAGVSEDLGPEGAEIRCGTGCRILVGVGCSMRGAAAAGCEAADALVTDSAAARASRKSASAPNSSSMASGEMVGQRAPERPGSIPAIVASVLEGQTKCLPVIGKVDWR